MLTLVSHVPRMQPCSRVACSLYGMAPESRGMRYGHQVKARKVYPAA